MNPHANLLLVCATKVESRAILEVFQNASNKPAEPTSIADRMYHNLGLINNTTVFMMQCEMGAVGPGASLLTIGKGINALSPDAVIMVGIAFGVNPKKQAVGDVLISQQLMLYDVQRVGTKANSAKPLLIPRGDRPHASSWLLDRFRSAETYWDDKFKVTFGPILSGEKLIDNIDFRQQLREFEPEAIGGEMEGAGLYVACQDAKVDWILVKSICDWADGHKSTRKNSNQKKAAHNAANFVLHVIKQSPLKKEIKGGQSIATAALVTENRQPAQVTILLDKDIQNFTPFEQDSFVHVLSRIVNVNPDQIRVLRVVKGSTILTVEMPEDASKILYTLYLEQAPEIRSLQISKIEFADPNQLALLFQGVSIWNTWRANHSDVKIVLNQGKLNSIDLKSASLRDADLRWASLMGTYLKGADLRNADLRGANLNEANLCEIDLRGASLIDANLSGSNLRDANLSRADLSEAKLNGADLTGANLNGANLREADLKSATLKRANLSETMLDGANLSGAKLGNTIIAFTNLGKVTGMDKIEHFGRSSIGLETIINSKGNIPEAFFRACGFGDIDIEAIKLLNPDVSKDEIIQIPHKIFDLHINQALQISPLFISYSQADSAFVDKLERQLNEKGIRYWRDIRDLKAGRLEKQIDRAISQNRTVLLVLSEHSLSSDWVENEVRVARGLEKEFGRDVLCPVALDDSWKSSHWPKRVMEQIMEYNILDFSAWHDDTKFENLFRKLIDGLELFYKG